jgi:hypothetical protein
VGRTLGVGVAGRGPRKERLATGVRDDCCRMATTVVPVDPTARHKIFSRSPQRSFGASVVGLNAWFTGAAAVAPEKRVFHTPACTSQDCEVMERQSQPPPGGRGPMPAGDLPARRGTGLAPTSPRRSTYLTKRRQAGRAATGSGTSLGVARVEEVRWSTRGWPWAKSRHRGPTTAQRQPSRSCPCRSVSPPCPSTVASAPTSSGGSTHWSGR